jgi:hypothetical protein
MFFLVGGWMLKRRRNARCTADANSILMNSQTQEILYCILAFLISTDAAARLAPGERSSGGIWKFRTSSFKCYVDPNKLILMMSAWRSKLVELYTYRYKIKIYHKLHLLVYLLEYMKMHVPGNIKKSYVDHLHTMYSSGNIDVRNSVHFLNHAVQSDTALLHERLKGHNYMFRLL